MCGIAGMIDGSLSREQGELLLGGMLESIRHRGPDNSSTWINGPVWLGHNRLSIIDLSDAANQPMEYDDLVIVYNGEVYNYLEIKNELIRKGRRFSTTSDTEVILAAYKEWGADCVQRFVGMWAFAIWDKRKKELFCSRDRFGIKPFYYIHTRGKFYFGSEYKPLKLSPLFDGKLNYRQLSRGVQLGWISYRDETYFDCLKALPEGCNLFFDGQGVKVRKYWDVDATKRFEGSYEDKTRRFRELFEDSVKLHMRSDVEVGGFLSGGLDSSSIAAMVGTNFSQVPYKTFTIYYTGKDQMDERRWVNDLTAQYGSLVPFHYNPANNEVSQAFDRVMEAHDAPITSSAPVNCYFVMRLAAEHRLKVILDGQGSDEYLAGYPWSANRLQPRLASVTEHSIAEADYLSYYPFLSMDRTIPFSLGEVSGSRLSQNLYHLMFHTLLPALLHFGDRISMSFSIESRVPFLDHRLVEFAFALQDDDKIYEGRTKRVLRDALGSFLPKSIVGRTEKQAFLGGEMDMWLRGPLSHLLETDLDRLDMLDTKVLKRVLTEYRNGQSANAMLVWRLAALNEWLGKQKPAQFHGRPVANADLASDEARSAEGSTNGGFFLSQANPHPQRDVIAKCFHPTGSFIEFKSEDVAQSIAARFEQQVARYPQRLAIKSKQRELTYCELNREANRIARSILAQRGPGQEAVALLLGDAAAMSSAILGALKAAKIYVPLDPTMPLPGLASIVENSQASTLLTDNSLLPLSRELCRQDILPINIDELASNPETENPSLSISPDYLAYILYTSGSTGKPKAVFQDHGNVLKKTLLYTNTAHISADDKFSLVAPFGFAAVMQSFFGSLLNGAALYPWKMQDEANLAEWLRAEEITIYRSAASVFRHLIDTLRENEKLPRLRLIDLFGEPITAADIEHYKKHLSPDFILRNHFASTETGIVSEYYVDRSTRLTTSVVPVGYPVEGAEIRLLDEQRRPVGLNTTGEIAVKTRDLVLGYWRDPELTHTKFIPDSEAGGDRVFLTGDLGRMLPDGCLIHMGRKDSRVKIRGHTVEPTAVEMTLLEHAAIKEAVVVAQEDSRNDRRLVAYVVSSPNSAVRPLDLRAFLESRLQTYMVPSVFVLLDALPLNSNGKVDRQALPVPERPKRELGADFVSPQSDTEKALAEIWREVLQLDEVGIHDSFLELGGHSLDAVRVMSRIFNVFGVQLSVDVFFANPTLVGVAEAIQKIQRDSWDVEEAAEDLAARCDAVSETKAECRPTGDKNRS